MKLLAISNPEFIPDEAALINSLFREGLVCLHIRKPESREDNFANLLSQIEPDFLGKIAIHQHHNLTEEVGVKGLHFTEKNRKMADPEMLKTLKSRNFLLSTSIHDLAEMDNLSPHFDYTFFGPVFNSISKTGYSRVIQDDFFLKDNLKKVQVIALGGIDHTNLDQIKKMNFDGAAILGALWKNPINVISSFRQTSQVLKTCEV
ncbi:thiamine phosphate synthase [Dyadobacter psychrotolerans]|uniref:Thiamine phosphate synthase n=1 Tax=Dyadobacter psychrotolerans TaxID=2541721 RepID=A0A4R5DUN6_9BACT|nr:thiamine phosphate synthase [Dyadobacter psychrotolerans]TDE18212.1 thiamine phosphate synthase [Dyadobacter psychrotolerans]